MRFRVVSYWLFTQITIVPYSQWTATENVRKRRTRHQDGFVYEASDSFYIRYWIMKK
jgi:hypothetical protein